jgi:hypothetical protein
VSHDEISATHEDGWRYIPGMRYETLETIRHRLVNDTVPAEKIRNPRLAEALDFTPASPEVRALDEERTARRKATIGRILPVIGILLPESLRVTEQAMLIDGSLGMTDREKQIAGTTVIAVLSSLMDMGILNTKGDR